MKYIKITKDNMPKIYDRIIKTIAKRGKLKCYHSYPETIKLCNQIKNAGCNMGNHRHIVKSAISNFDSVKVELELDFCTGSSFIRIQNNENSSKYKATIIKEGDRISFNRSQVFTKGMLFKNSQPYIKTITFY